MRKAMVEKIELMAGKMLKMPFHVRIADSAKNRIKSAKSGMLREIFWFLL